MVKLSLQELRQYRSYSQGLAAKSSSVHKIIHHLCGLQSQELNSASLAIRVRTAKLSLDDVKAARESERSIVLTWAMRGTMHLISSNDYLWLSQLLSPIFLNSGKRRRAELNLPDDTVEKANKLIREMLAKKGAMIRSEIAKALALHGIPVEGQAIAHIVAYAALSGLICFGAERNGELTYVLLEDWLKPDKSAMPKYPELELARRYLAAYAPASPQDFASWSGISMKAAKQAFADLSSELKEIEAEGQIFWMLKSQELELVDTLCLLPRYDNYWLGYQNRDLLVAEAYAKEINRGGGIIRPAMAINGEGKGSWRIEQKSGKVIVNPFESLSPDTIPQIEAEVADIGRFLKQSLHLEIENP